MKEKIFAVAFVVALCSFVLNSCDTPVGQGAGWGAATGAIIGGAATGTFAVQLLALPQVLLLAR